MTPEEIKKAYTSRGYSVVAFTDHDVLIPHPELADEKFLPLNAYEMEINEHYPMKPDSKTCHMCLIALEPDNVKQVCFHRSKYLPKNSVNYVDQVKYDENEPDYEREYTGECINDIMKKARDNGFFVTYNHPTWSREGHNDYDRYDYMHAMEVFNSECEVLGHFEYNEKDYDHMLANGKRIYCVATDDTHSKEACFCFRLFRHLIPFALSLALFSTGSSIAARMAMIEITIRSSIKVKLLLFSCIFLSALIYCSPYLF